MKKEPKIRLVGTVMATDKQHVLYSGRGYTGLQLAKVATDLLLAIKAREGSGESVGLVIHPGMVERRSVELNEILSFNDPSVKFEFTPSTTDKNLQIVTLCPIKK